MTQTDDPVIPTERLTLRRSRPEDAEPISGYRSDPEVHRYQGWDATDPEQVRLQIEEMALRAPGSQGWVQLSVIERTTQELVGDVGLCPAEEPGVVKIGYTIKPDRQGKGYATEAVAALIGYIFGELGATTVRAYADADNVASIRVAERVGMRLVETFEETDEEGTWRGVRYERTRS